MTIRSTILQVEDYNSRTFKSNPVVTSYVCCFKLIFSILNNIKKLIPQSH